MRKKITLLLSTALAGSALMAAIAAPAQADKAFIVTSQAGSPCVSVCQDGTHEGIIRANDEFKSMGRCDVSFDINVKLYGALDATNIETSNCTDYLAFASLDDCGGSWPGQIRILDSGAVRVNMTTCFEGAYGGPVHHALTYKVGLPEGFRKWTQEAPVPGVLFGMETSEFTDFNLSNDVKLVLN